MSKHASQRVEVNLEDPFERREWEQLFAMPAWQKWSRIQQTRLDEIKENAWVLFQDDIKRQRYLAEINLLEELLQFEPDTKAAMAMASEETDSGS